MVSFSSCFFEKIPGVYSMYYSRTSKVVFVCCMTRYVAYCALGSLFFLVLFPMVEIGCYPSSVGVNALFCARVTRVAVLPRCAFAGCGGPVVSEARRNSAIWYLSPHCLCRAHPHSEGVTQSTWRSASSQQSATSIYTCVERPAPRKQFSSVHQEPIESAM